jgi:hypothetical protein
MPETEFRIYEDSRSFKDDDDDDDQNDQGLSLKLVLLLCGVVSRRVFWMLKYLYGGRGSSYRECSLVYGCFMEGVCAVGKHSRL